MSITELRKKLLSGEISSARFQELLDEDEPGTTYGAHNGRVVKVPPGYVPNGMGGIRATKETYSPWAFKK